MNGRFKPVSRLSIVFILAVVISGSLLTYFSINNISNLKELTEKRIQEEQRAFFNRVSDAFQSYIEKVTHGFSEEILPVGRLKDSLINIASTHYFIKLPFILKNDGSFLYPNFIGIREHPLSTKHTPKYLSTFRKGEIAEFTGKNLITAKNQYLKSLEYATGNLDSANIFNALGRISVKQHNEKEALKYYQIIINKYFSATGVDGNPYLYYAIPQILKMKEPQNQEKIWAVLEFSLQKMKNGEIPLNYYTEELINSISTWVGIVIEARLSKERINHLITQIKIQLKFVETHGKDLAKLVATGDPQRYLSIGNDFIIANSYAERDQELLLINTNLTYPIGFLLDRKSLLAFSNSEQLQSDLEFRYKIETTSGYDGQAKDHQLTYTTQLNPYFPGQFFHIKMNNENLFREMVKRRSWTYRVALVLLLVAMLLGVVLILRDIAREKRLVVLRSDFISNVTHELKTPLTSIYMFAESLLLGRVKMANQKKEYLSIILKESERLKRLINNILEFSKMEKGKSEYHFINSNIAGVIKAAIQDMSYWFQKGKFEIITELDTNIEAEIDPEKIKQAIGNLLSNAYKYSIKTKKILVRLLRKKDKIAIEVEDQGLGIPPNDLNKIFEKYYRINHSESISGTGLGLTVVKEIVEAHHGRISVTSKLGKGSKFTITLNKQMKEV